MMTANSVMSEIWKAVPGWPYEASDLGRIRRLCDDNFEPAGSIVVPWTKGQKYPMVILYRATETWGVRENWPVAAHRVIAEAWLGPMPAPGWEVDHVDGDRSDLRPEKLEWVPPGENIRRAVARGHRGEKRYNAKLTEEKVREIWALRSQGLSATAIADQVGASESSVCHVLGGRNWKHLKPGAVA